MRDTMGNEYGPTVINDTYGDSYIANRAYLEYCEMMGVAPSSQAWMAYCEWTAAGNAMA